MRARDLLDDLPVNSDFVGNPAPAPDNVDDLGEDRRSAAGFRPYAPATHQL
ncbi:MAG TPA: hypothetical protein VNY35_04860 [Solirubrobacteraceae bacterium]|nr:hypothetical protein [Solirubrobacteraceae bacterium]